VHDPSTLCQPAVAVEFAVRKRREGKKQPESNGRLVCDLWTSPVVCTDLCCATDAEVSDQAYGCHS
jgi:hypothetical protein